MNGMAFFWWMLAGLVELLSATLILIGGQDSRKVHARFSLTNDPVGTCIHQCCHMAPDVSVSKETLRETFREFCSVHEIPNAVGDWFFKVSGIDGRNSKNTGHEQRTGNAHPDSWHQTKSMKTTKSGPLGQPINPVSVPIL